MLEWPLALHSSTNADISDVGVQGYIGITSLVLNATSATASYAVVMDGRFDFIGVERLTWLMLKGY